MVTLWEALFSDPDSNRDWTRFPQDHPYWAAPTRAEVDVIDPKGIWGAVPAVGWIIVMLRVFRLRRAATR